MGRSRVRADCLSACAKYKQDFSLLGPIKHYLNRHLKTGK